jgi:short subunit dehydrogenase-like uncharacterized protein
MIYGANGFSGRAVADRLRQAGHDPLLAGRGGREIAAVAASLGVEHRIFDLRDPGAIAAGMAGVGVLLNAAGPFIETAPPLIEACLRGGAHYLDLAGEWPVFDLALRRGPEAAAAGVMLMPGAAFSIVVSDCVLAHAIAQVPDAVLLRVATAQAPLSRGSVLSAIALMSPDVLVRRGGVVCRIPVGQLTRSFNLGAGEQTCVAVSAPDVVTGEQTTGVGAIETYLEAPLAWGLAYGAGALALKLKGAKAVGETLRRASRRWPDHPSPAAIAQARGAVVVETVDPWRRTRRFGLRTLNGYAVTVAAAQAIVERVLRGEVTPGFQTPAGRYGAGLVVSLGCAWTYDASPFAVAAVDARRS